MIFFFFFFFLGGGGEWPGRMDVNTMLGLEGDVGNGGCEPRIEGIVQCTIRAVA